MTNMTQDTETMTMTTRYQIQDADGKPAITGTINQTGHSDEDAMHPTTQLSDIRLTHTCSVKIVTSGYSDRYLAMESHYTAVVSGDAGEVARFHWSDRRDVVNALVFLTGASWEDCYAFVTGTTTEYCSTWERATNTTCSGPVRFEVLNAIASLASHQHSPRFTAEAVERFRSTVATATPDEIACARYWLSECNRLNARTGREQVAFPE